MGDIALMPERYILKAGLGVRARHSREPANLFRGDRISLVRHCARSLLTRRERLLYLAHLRSLQVPDLERDFFHRGRYDRKRRKKLRITVPLHHLGRNRSRLDRQLLTHSLFYLGVKMSECTLCPAAPCHRSLLSSA